jgi:hypothetical protein
MYEQKRELNQNFYMYTHMIKCEARHDYSQRSYYYYFFFIELLLHY